MPTELLSTEPITQEAAGAPGAAKFQSVMSLITEPPKFKEQDLCNERL